MLRRKPSNASEKDPVQKRKVSRGGSMEPQSPSRSVTFFSSSIFGKLGRKGRSANIGEIKAWDSLSFLINPHHS